MEVDGATDVDFAEFANLVAFADSPLTDVAQTSNVSRGSEKHSDLRSGSAAVAGISAGHALCDHWENSEVL